jgi:regulator of sirC expression with transglutaminase-like and TPR domain
VGPTEQFELLVQRAEYDIPLDEACFVIAAHAHPTLDVDAGCRKVDALAGSLAVDDARSLARVLFVDRGYAGNTVDYGDPRNSYLDDVLDRRLGIPITLSVLMIEVGRRLLIPVHGVGMPGHFLVGTDDATRWYDPFHGGLELDRDGCRARFAETHDAGAFRDEYLAPVGPLAILDRMLANLQHSLIARAPADAAWPTRLRLRLPQRSAAERGELAGLLGSLGHFSEAAKELDALARDLPSEHASDAARAAARFRARAN